MFHSGRTRVVFVLSENVSVSRFLFRYVPTLPWTFGWVSAECWSLVVLVVVSQFVVLVVFKFSVSSCSGLAWYMVLQHPGVLYL